MSAIKELARVYDALMSIKTLKANVELDLRVPARMTLLLAMAVNQALSGNDPGNSFRKLVSEDDQARLVDLLREILKKKGVGGILLKIKGAGTGIRMWLGSE